MTDTQPTTLIVYLRPGETKDLYVGPSEVSAKDDFVVVTGTRLDRGGRTYARAAVHYPKSSVIRVAKIEE